MAELVVQALCSGKQRDHSSKFIRPARKFIASLWMHESDLFRWSTKAEYYGAKRKQVWLTSATLAVSKKMMELGYINEVAEAIPPALSRDGTGKSAIYCRSSKFMREMTTLTFSDVVLDPDLDRITLRDHLGSLVPIDDDTRQQLWFKRTEAVLKEHSRLLVSEPIRKADGTHMRPIDKHYFRRFKGGFDKTGRLYSGFINWSKEERLQITFKNGEPAFSIDLSSLHPYLILRLFHNKDMYRPSDMEAVTEPYGVPEFNHLPRAVHKKAVGILLNAENVDVATRALYSTYYVTGEDGEVKVKTYKGAQGRSGVKAFPGNKKEALAYIDAFRKHHPHLASTLCTGIGNYLQRIDSDIMLETVAQANIVGIPILPVHDEIILPIRDLKQVLEFLTFSFRSWLSEGRNLLLLNGYEDVLFTDAADFGEVPLKISYYADGNTHEERHNINLEYKWWEHTGEFDTHDGSSIRD